MIKRVDIRRHWRILFLVSCAILLFSDIGAQSISGRVVDEQGQPLVNVHLKDTTSANATLTDAKGRFYLDVKSGSVLQSSHIGYRTTNTTVRGEKTEFLIRLFPSVEVLNAFTITSDPVQSVVEELHVNLIDYLPFRHYVVALKKKGRHRFLSVEGVDTTFAEFPLHGLRGVELFEDCFGNIYLLSKDSCYQVYADTALYVVDAQPMEMFDSFIRPCIGDLNGQLIIEHFRMLNKQYVVEAVSKADSLRTTVFTSQDEIAAKVAAINLQQIFTRYSMLTPPEQNVLTNGVWNGNLVSMQVHGDHRLNRMISWYLNVRGKEIDLTAFEMNDHLLVFDMFNDSIHVFDAGLKPAHQTAFHPPTKKSSTQLLVDDEQTAVYVVENKGMMRILHQVDILSGTISNVTRLDETFNAENIKIADGWAYYLMAKNGFHKLYRTRLNE